MEQEITFAKEDPALGLASLFRPVTRGPRPGGVERVTEFDGVRIHWAIWQELDCRDQSVLLATIGMAGVDHEKIDASHDSQLWHYLRPKNEAKKDRAISFTTTRYQLIKAAGLPDSGPYYGILEKCLHRLSAVSCHAYANGCQWSMAFLSFEEDQDGNIEVALNGRFADALADQYVRVELTERHDLTSEAAQIAHAYLSAWLRPGKSNSIGIDKLTSKVWGQNSKVTSTQRSRRNRIHKALKEIDDLPGWGVRVTGTGKHAKATIKRPQIYEQEPTEKYRNNGDALP